MATKIYLRVCDEDGNPLAMKPAWLMERNGVKVIAEFVSEADHVWSLDLDPQIVGDVHLVLRIAGHPALPFSMHAQDGEASPFAFRKQVPRCASLTRQVVTRGADQSVAVVALQFDLAKQHDEVVLVGGIDYHGTAKYIVFAETTRDDSYEGATYFGGTRHAIPRTIYDHTIVTLFDFEAGVRRRQIKGQKGWHELDAIALGAKPPHLERPDSVAQQHLRGEEDTISIVHVYDHISKLGADAPRTLRQLHFYSHAWSGGPALINTFEASEYQNMYCKGIRDPHDKDPRCKDFCEENIPDFTSFCAAFAAGAYVKVWGCLRHGLNKYIESVIDLDDPEVLGTICPDGNCYTTWEIVEKIRREATPYTYLANVIKKVGIDGFGAVPTSASNYQGVNGRSYMFIDRNNHGKHLGWFERYFHVKPDEWGYVDFRALF